MSDTGRAKGWFGRQILAWQAEREAAAKRRQGGSVMQTKKNRATPLDIERLAQELIALDTVSPEAVLGHLHPDDADAVVVHAQAVLRQDAGAKFAEADMLEKMVRVAHATGCPNGEPIIPWLESHGLIERAGEKFALTPKAAALRLVGS